MVSEIIFEKLNGADNILTTIYNMHYQSIYKDIKITLQNNLVDVMNKTLLRFFTWLYYKFPILRISMMRIYRMFFPPVTKKYPRLGEAPELLWNYAYDQNIFSTNKTESKHQEISTNKSRDDDTNSSIEKFKSEQKMCPKIVVMYRIKNEQRWIGHSLKSVSDFCDEIVILDNGSTDDTIKICQSYPKVVDLQINNEAHLPLDDAKSKNTLLQMALKRNPDYILALDGDEILQPFAKNILLYELTVLYPDAHMFEFQLLTIWDKPNVYRYDGVYGNFWNKRLIKMNEQPKDLRFLETEHPGNIHNPSIPINAIGWDKPVKSKVRIFHYNLYEESMRRRKYDYFQKADPNNKVYDGYRHLIGAYGKFSGPDGLELRHIPKEFYIEDIKSSSLQKTDYY